MTAKHLVGKGDYKACRTVRLKRRTLLCSRKRKPRRRNSRKTASPRRRRPRPPTNETPQSQSWYSTNNKIPTWVYDGAGNITSIPAMSRAFSYDGEDRQETAIINGT